MKKARPCWQRGHTASVESIDGLPPESGASAECTIDVVGIGAGLADKLLSIVHAHQEHGSAAGTEEHLDRVH
jgi:hypothetical protein